MTFNYEYMPKDNIIDALLFDRTQRLGTLPTLTFLEDEVGLTKGQIVGLGFFEDYEFLAAEIVSEEATMAGAVEEMDRIVRNFNDEELHMYWLANGLPDGSTPDEIYDDIVDSRDTYDEYAEAFIETVNMARKLGEDIDEKTNYFYMAIESTLSK